MASSFPGAIDNFTDPLANSSLASPSHAGQHSDLNDAVEKVEQYMGLVKVIPTSGTNCTVGATGTVTIGNAVTSATINGCFSTLYDNYRVLISNVGASNSDGLLMQIGTINTGVYYGSWTYALFNAAALTVNGMNAATAGTIGLTNSATPNVFSVIEIANPALALEKFFTVAYYGRGYAGMSQGAVGSATAQTSLKIIAGAGTLTGGSIRVYGYRN